MPRALMAVALGVVAALSLQTIARASDALYVHGHIYTAVPAAPWAEALAVTGSRIDAVGTDAAILKRRGARTQLIDLQGRTVIPGIFDSHLHLMFGAMALHGFNLSTPAGSVTPDKRAELITRIRKYAAEHPEDRSCSAARIFPLRRRTRRIMNCLIQRSATAPWSSTEPTNIRCGSMARPWSWPESPMNPSRTATKSATFFAMRADTRAAC
jgi:hypothetical protein